MRREAERIRTAYARRQKHDSRYSWFNSSYLFMMQEREQRLLTLLQPHCCALPKSRILEIGCGTGYWLREFIKWGAQPENIAGVDLLSERTVEARKLCPEMVQIHDGNAAELPFADQTFDVVLQSTVFTSVLDPNVKQQIAAEMLRVVKSDGLLLWYDYYVNNPWNADVRGVNRQELAQLFPGCSMRLQRITLAPPLVRILAPYSWLACYLLSKVPWLCTHYLGVIRKRL
ncbi:MAG: class I SAM-dependent methyltransferase [Candidatus Tectimicrobiota bacterium]